ncbi:hypothetical protein L2E82_33814 [Cichorium intybus]|uniref:Uncharacterized protein n=1 Tax=Cichorium intybus TaxID=13427 RepID=A0ACB9BL37_CICIN|nr:hypothetical protein L2E82_33814 [Cichorium intybus]
MAGIRLPPEDIDISQARALSTADLISDDDRSIAADSWSIKSDYGSTLDDDQRHADASEALAAARFCAASDYSSDKDEPDAETITSMLGFQSYWDATYADELTNFREHGDAGEVWFGADVMEMVASWTKGLCIDISQKHLQNHNNDNDSESVNQEEKDLASWSVLDVGTGNGLLLQELAKQGFSDLTGTDYSEGAINLARNLANRDGFNGIKLLVDDVLETKLDKKFELVMDKGTLDAIGLHPDGPIKRIMYWESMPRLVAPGGLLVITSCNNTKEELVQEVENFNQRKIGEVEEEGKGLFCYLDHIRSYPTFMFGGSVGSRVATVAFVLGKWV